MTSRREFIAGAGASLACDCSTYQYRIDPERFAEACLDAAKAVNASYVWALTANPAK